MGPEDFYESTWIESVVKWEAFTKNDLRIAEIRPSDNRPKWWANSKSWEAFRNSKGLEQETDTRGKGKSNETDSKTKAIPSRGDRRTRAKAVMDVKATASGSRVSLPTAMPNTRGRKRKAVSDDKSAMPTSKHSLRFEERPAGVRKPIERKTPEMDGPEGDADTMSSLTATPEGAQGTSSASVSIVSVLHFDDFDQSLRLNM
jgi:hypothetical protein